MPHPAPIVAVQRPATGRCWPTARGDSVLACLPEKKYSLLWKFGPKTAARTALMCLRNSPSNLPAHCGFTSSVHEHVSVGPKTICRREARPGSHTPYDEPVTMRAHAPAPRRPGASSNRASKGGRAFHVSNSPPLYRIERPHRLPPSMVGWPRRGAATRASAPRPTLPPSACPTVHRPRHPRRSGHAPRRRTPSLPPGRPHPVGPDSDGPDDRRPMGRRPVAGPHQGPYHLHVGRHRRRRVLTRWTGSLRPGPCPRAHRGTSAGPAGRGRLA